MKGQEKRGRLIGRREVLGGIAGIIASGMFPQIVIARPRIRIEAGVPFWKLPRPVNFLARYPAWRFDPSKNTMRVRGSRAGRFPTPHRIIRQDKTLEAFGLNGVDAVQ